MDAEFIVISLFYYDIGKLSFLFISSSGHAGDLSMLLTFFLKNQFFVSLTFSVVFFFKLLTFLYTEGQVSKIGKEELLFSLNFLFTSWCP